MKDQLEEELKERLNTKRLDKLVASFSGACISKGHCYSIDDDRTVFVKTNGTSNCRIMFDGELESLRQIEATKTIRVPKPLAVLHDFDKKGGSALVTEFIDMREMSSECGKSLGEQLASMHNYNKNVITYNKRAASWIGRKTPSAKHAIQETISEDDVIAEQDEGNQFCKHKMNTKTIGSFQPSSSGTPISNDRFHPEPGTQDVLEFGFDVPTSCGAIPQANEWTKDWVSFYARHRLDNTIRLILSEHGNRDLNEQWSHLQNKISQFFSDFQYKGSGEGEIIPSLLHGDLWSGNAAQLNESSSKAVVYDPAAFYGHYEYEFGIVRMFGGFPKEFESTYFTTMETKRLFEKRNKLYQLFHHLNHWNHFGSGYMSSTLSLMKDLNAMKL